MQLFNVYVNINVDEIACLKYIIFYENRFLLTSNNNI